MEAGCQMAFSDFTSPAYISEAGAIAEDLGFTNLWVPEHVVFFKDYESRYPYTASGRLPGEPSSLLDPLTALTFVAANTSSIRLGTGVCLVPQRNPVYCAKQVADLDYLSSGRFDFGMGIGWLREEFEALGVPWQGRAKRLEECIGVMQALWGQEVSEFSGVHFSFSGVYQNPKPIQTPHPPIVFGGESGAALSRVARLGQGWYGYNLTNDAFSEAMDALSNLLQEQGRSLDQIKVFVTPAQDSLDASNLKRFEKSGAQQIILPLLSNDPNKLRSRGQQVIDLIKSA